MEDLIKWNDTAAKCICSKYLHIKGPLKLLNDRSVLPFHIPQLVQSLPSYTPEALKRSPFWAEPSHIGHYSVCTWLVNLSYKKTRAPSCESGEDCRCTETPTAGGLCLHTLYFKGKLRHHLNQVLIIDMYCYKCFWMLYNVLSYQCTEWIWYVTGWSARSCLLCQPVVQPIPSQDSSSLHLLCEQAVQWHLQ